MDLVIAEEYIAKAGAAVIAQTIGAKPPHNATAGLQREGEGAGRFETPGFRRLLRS